MTVEQSTDSTALVFPRPFLRVDSDILRGFDLGRFATALVGSDRVIVQVARFSDLIPLFEEIPQDEFASLLKQKRIQFLLQPEEAGVLRFDGVEPHLGIMTIGGDPRASFAEPGGLQRSIRADISDHPLCEVELSAEMVELISSSTTVVPLELSSRLLSEMVKDVVDIRYRPALSRWLQECCRTSYSPLEHLRVSSDGNSICIHVDILDVVQGITAEKNAHTAALVLYEGYRQFSISALAGTSTLYTEAPFYGFLDSLCARTGSATTTGKTPPVNVVTKTFELPDLGWLVNRNALRLGDVVSFFQSERGSQFRGFLKSFLADSGDAVALQVKMQQAIIQSFHDRTWWEKNWSSERGELSRFTATQLIGLAASGWMGTALGVVAGLVDMAAGSRIPKTFRPTLIFQAELDEKIDSVRLNAEARRKHLFPSLAKLRRLGFEATMAFEKEGGNLCLILDKPGVDEHWSLEIDPKDVEGKIYFSSFEALLPPLGTKLRQLTDALGKGASIEIVNITGSTDKFKASFTLRLRDRSSLVIADDSDEFVSFVLGRDYLRDPKKYEKFQRDNEA